MTREEVEDLSERELNEAIAKYVMGLTLEEGRGMFLKIPEPLAKLFGVPDDVYRKPNLVVKEENAIGEQREIPRYSRDIDAAWQVVGKMRGAIFSKRLRFLNELQRQTELNGTMVAWPDVFWKINPVAISRAALNTHFETQKTQK